MDEGTAFYLRKLQELAPRMQRLRGGWWPRLRYHPLAGAIYWTDEVPWWTTGDEEDALRGVLYYRTTLFLGRPDESAAVFWTTAEREFPKWVGFSPKRLTPDPKVVRFYERESKAFITAFERDILPHITSVEPYEPWADPQNKSEA